jgi:hypothetical protein
MKKLLISLAASAVALTISACAGGYYGPGGPVVGPVAYDGFYDDAYGPFYDGYWGGDGAFYYSDGEGHPFHRDTGGHFRHDMAQGFHPVHGFGGMHGGGHRPA